MNLIEAFTSRTGQVIRVKHDGGEPIFCAKDVCAALGIVNYRNKTDRLDADEKLVSTQRTGGQRRNMLFVTEPGLYSIILTCRGATTPGTPAHAFRRWVTHEVLPSIRRGREYRLRETIENEKHEEKGRRLWIVLKEMDLWNFNARRKYFGTVCNACAACSYKDEFNSPHIWANRLDECKQIIRTVVSRAILSAVPKNQKLMTDFFHHGV
jgi:prophage antirepressor-like protein